MQKARTSKTQPHNLLLHKQHCAFWIAFQQTDWLNWLAPETKMKGYFLSIAQRTNHLIELSPYNQYKPVLPTIYPNSVYCPNPFCGFGPHICLPCAACAQYMQSICTHKYCSNNATYSSKQQNHISKPNNIHIYRCIYIGTYSNKNTCCKLILNHIENCYNL